jgi:hypothetical protein
MKIFHSLFFPLLILLPTLSLASSLASKGRKQKRKGKIISGRNTGQSNLSKFEQRNSGSIRCPNVDELIEEADNEEVELKKRMEEAELERRRDSEKTFFFIILIIIFLLLSFILLFLYIIYNFYLQQV